MNIVFIEGVPGSGKSTLTEYLENSLRAKECKVSSYGELSKEHPIFSLRFGNLDVHDPQYLDCDLERWRDFIKHHHTRDETYIFDAAPFQNSVRYAFESGKKDSAVEYLNKLQCLLASLSVIFIYLKPPCIIDQIEYCIDHKGNQWGKHVTEYIEKTHCAIENHWTGIDGMKSFWYEYSSLCDELVTGLQWKKKAFSTAPDTWNIVQNEISDFVVREILNV